jgi:hypothetical protein
VPRTGALDPGASTTSTSSPETRDEKYWFWKRKRHNLDLSLNMIRVIYMLNIFTNLRNYFYYQNCTLLMAKSGNFLSQIPGSYKKKPETK